MSSTQYRKLFKARQETDYFVIKKLSLVQYFNDNVFFLNFVIILARSSCSTTTINV